jgi:hypothetical protein
MVKMLQNGEVSRFWGIHPTHTPKSGINHGKPQRVEGIIETLVKFTSERSKPMTLMNFRKLTRR